MEENKKQLYDFLIGEGLFEGTDKSFDSMYSDDDGINFLYKSLSETGYYNGSDKDFKDQFFTPKKKDLTWSQDFGKAYESMPQGSPSGTKSPTTPSASTSPKREFSLADEVIAGIDVMHPFAGAILSRNKASASELKAEERFANYTNAVKNINGRIEKSTVAADQLVKQYEALGAEMNQLNQIITSKLTPQAEKTLAALRGKQIEAQGEQIKSQLAGLKSNYEVDVNRKRFLFKAAIDQKAIIENKVNDDFSFAKHFSTSTFGLIIKSAGSAINGFGDLAEMTHKIQWGISNEVSSDKITDKIGTDLANIGSAIYDEAQGRVPEAAQWRPEMGLKELTPFRTAVFATNAIASTTPSILAALSGSKTATITTSAIMNFGDAYDVAKQRGFSDEKAALVAAAITVPVTMLDQLGLNQILKANKNAFSQFVKIETLKRLAGKELSKDAIFAVSKEVFTEGLKRFGKTAGKIVALEVPTEAAQGAMQEAGIQLADKQKLDYAKLGYATEAEALGGFFGAGAMSLGASYKAMRFNPTAYGVAMGTKNAEFAADLQEMIAQEVKTGNLTEEQAQEVTQNIKTIVETDAIIPSTVTNLDARIDAINLVGEKNALMKEMEGMEPAMVLDKKERIKQIETELTNISLTNLPTNAQTTNTEATTGAGQTNNGPGGTGGTSGTTTATGAGQTPGANAQDIRSQAEQQREQVRKDMEIEAFQERTGFPLYDPFEQMPDMVQVTLGRVADGDTVDPVQVKEASDWLYTEYKRLDAMKVADNRTMTIPQIEEIQAEIEGEITLLENEYNQVEQQNQERAAVGESNQQAEGVTATETGTEVNGASTETIETGEAATTEGQEAPFTQEEGTGPAQETAGTEDQDKLDDNVIAEAKKRGITAPHALRILDKYTPNWRTNPDQAKAFDAAMRVRAAQKGDKAQAGKWSLLSKNPKLFFAVRMINRTFGMLGVKTLILNDSDFNAIHESISGQAGSGKLRNATFDPMTKTIYLKSSNLAQTAFHEIAHPFLDSLRLSDQAAYDAIVERVKSLDAVKPDTRGKSYFQWAQDLYAGKDQSVIDNEAVAEFLADTLSGGVGVSNMLKAEAMQVVNDILKAFGYKGTINKPVTLKFIAENIPNFETIVTQAVANSMILEGEAAEAEEQEMRDQVNTVGDVVSVFHHTKVDAKDFDFGNFQRGKNQVSQFGDGLAVSTDTTPFLQNRYGKAIKGEVKNSDFVEIDTNKTEKEIYEELKVKGYKFNKPDRGSYIGNDPAKEYDGTEKANEQPAIISLFNDFQKSNPEVKGVKIINHIIGNEKVSPFYVIYDNKSFYGEGSLKGKAVEQSLKETPKSEAKEEVKVENTTGGLQDQVVAIHGGPRKFSEFKTEAIGGSSNGLAFGWGLYFTELKDAAKYYASIEEENTGNKGYIYMVTLFKDKSPSDYTWMEWDKPLTSDNIEKIREQFLKDSLPKEITVPSNHSGKWYGKGVSYKAYRPDPAAYGPNESDRFFPETAGKFYDKLSRYFDESLIKDPEKEASLLLLRAGIDGIKYQAGRGAMADKTKGFNYVVFDEKNVTIEKVSDQNEMRDQIVGEKARLDEQTRQNKIVAQEMEDAGKDAKTIRMATGWEKGVDGKWRYEVEDPNFKFDNFEDLKEIVESKEKTMGGFYPVPLVDLFDNADFGDSYRNPLNRNVVVYFDPSVPIGQAYYSNGGIHVNILSAKYKSDFSQDGSFEEFKSMLLHEVQHHIQVQEGFSAPFSEEGYLFNLKYEIEKTKEQLQYFEDISKYEPSFLDRIPELKKELSSLQEKLNISDEELDRMYWNSSGEVEARNVQSRMNMTPEQRRNTLLSETEDVNREDQIMRDQMIPRETLENNQVATALEQEAIIAAADYMQNSINMDTKAAEYAAKSDDVIESDISKPVSITDENSEVVFAFMEAIKRAEAAPDRKFRGKTIPEILIPLSKIATFSGKVMRFMRMLPKFSTKAQSEAMFALIENNGYKLSPAQKTMLSEKIGAARLAVQAVEAAKTAYLNTGTEAARKLMEAEKRKQEKVDRDLADTLLPMLPADYLDRFISNMQGNIQAIPSLIANLTSGMEAWPRTLIETAARGFFDITVGAAIGRPKSAVLAIIAGFNPFWRGVGNIPSESFRTLIHGSDVQMDGNVRAYSSRVSPKAIYNSMTNPNMKMRVPGGKSFEVFETKDEIQVREVLSDVKGKLLGVYSDERVAAVEASKVPGSKAFGNEVYQMIKTQRGPVVSSYQKPVVPNQALLDNLLGQAEDEAYMLSTKPDAGHQFYFVTSQVLGLASEALNRVSTLTDNAVRNPLQMARLTEEARRLGMSVDRLVAYAATDETGEFPRYLEYIAKSPTYQQENKAARSIAKAEARMKNWIKGRDNSAVKVVSAVIFIMGKAQMLFTKTPLNVMNRMVDVIMSGKPSFAQAVYYFGESYAASKKGNIVKTDLNYLKGVNYLAKGISALAFNMAATFIAGIPGAVIAGYDSLDDKRKAALEAQRVPPGSINVSAVDRFINGGSSEWQKGDMIMPLRYYGQLGQAILFKTNIQTRVDVKAEKDASSGNVQVIEDKWLSDQMDEWLNEQLNVISAIPKQAFEFASMAGVNTLINTINADKGKKWSEWSRGMTQSILAGFGVPATYSKAMEEELKQELVDPNSMKNTVANVAKYRLGVSNPELFARVDALGFPVRNTAEGNYPLKRADYAPNEIWQKLIKLKEETKKPGVIPSSFRVGTEKVTDMLDIETYELLAKDTDTLNRMRGAYRVTELEKLFNDKTYELTNGTVGSVFDEPDLEVKARMVINAINEADNMFKPEYKKYLVELSRKAGYPKLKQLEQMLIDDNEQK